MTLTVTPLPHALAPFNHLEGTWSDMSFFTAIKINVVYVLNMHSFSGSELLGTCRMSILINTNLGGGGGHST